MHMAMGVIGSERCIGPARRQIARRLALPVFALAADLADPRSAMAVVERPEGRARLDRLQLLGIADQHHLRPGFRSLRQYPLELPRADHPGLIAHEDVPRRERFAPLFPALLQAREGARPDPRSALEVLGGDPGERCAADPVARRFRGFACYVTLRIEFA